MHLSYTLPIKFLKYYISIRTSSSFLQIHVVLQRNNMIIQSKQLIHKRRPTPSKPQQLRLWVNRGIATMSGLGLLSVTGSRTRPASTFPHFDFLPGSLKLLGKKNSRLKFFWKSKVRRIIQGHIIEKTGTSEGRPIAELVRP